ncbi:S-adenosyl-L-homocysteine hydrolase [Bradyrhizobium sp. Rc2d]|nr:S-adenosyl-L-homocysteine hydrolase [Bradyrhizobium sp. Rc2d]
MTIQTAVLVETLAALGADIRWVCKAQADYIGVNPEGRYKSDRYRY